MPTRLLALSACALLFSGCYASHDGTGRARRDAGPMPLFESGPPPRLDGDVPPPPPLDGDVPPPPPLDGDVMPPLDGDVPPPPLDAGPPPPPFDAGPPPPPTDAGPPPPPIDAGPPPPPIDAGGPRPALRFRSSTFFQVADAPNYDTAGEHTFEVWVRSRELGSAEFCRKGDAMARHMLVGQRFGNIVAGWQVGGAEYLTVGPPIPFDTWVHVALVARSEPSGTHTARLYVNGALVDTQTGLAQLVDGFNDVPFRCGRADVDVDEIRLWRVARSGASIAANYDRRVSGGNPGMVAYWRLDESGQIVFDYTAMGSVGVLGNLTTPDPADPTWILDGAI